jgi:predicted transcriptional regulator
MQQKQSNRFDLPSLTHERPMTKKKRNSMELIAEMLESARGGARQTAIMYRANLSYELLKVYLQLLVQRDLISSRDAEGLFHTSPKGMKYLKEYRKYGKLRESLLETQLAIASLLE